ncbi:phage tail protein [Pseudoalteromonas ruthenica]|uniref:Phage tail protein n=1 Tax=Pseudoalteromonas ruthenica TaxID=151081 RepID=A0A5S3Z8H8_9GAMM|nr:MULTISPECIES: phage protein [Pseudoalteromonas]MCG7567073.1 DUF2597 family protein [Pseudoalteromonas sp. CnMc7-15]MCG7570548.1 DUF2597 family protein [Pseudoalteromonas sp. CNC9-20]TLX52033.1 phage tail protein [Pseudoalteromonas ruthenica]TMP88518.1 phage tail protein [Pseudoalteromonas ruthenica]|tara:strand:+ start:70842 stop:71297 length:456 start_codon:yes stop_codon:yes gene_type:complete
MSQHKLSGKDFDVNVGDALVHVINCSLTIDDGRQVRMTNGVPDGFLDGPCTAKGELTVNHENFLIIQQEAQKAGSWKGIDPIDISMMGAVVSGEKNIESYGCLLKLSDVLSIDPEGAKADETKIPFEVTSSDFVKINGIPYLTAKEVENIV